MILLYGGFHIIRKISFRQEVPDIPETFIAEENAHELDDSLKIYNFILQSNLIRLQGVKPKTLDEISNALLDYLDTHKYKILELEGLDIHSLPITIISCFPNVEILKLKSMPGVRIDTIVTMKNLQQIEISNFDLSNEQVNVLIKASPIHKVSFFNSDLTKFNTGLLKEVKELKDLEIIYCKLSQPVIDAIFTIQSLQNISIAQIPSANGVFIWDLSKSKNLKNLKKFNFSTYKDDFRNLSN